MPEDDPLSSSGIRHEVGMHTASIPSRSRLIALAHSLRLGTTVLRPRLSHSHKDVLRPRLVPMGLIAADAAFHVPAGASRPAAATAPRSPLALSMRMAVINPRLIDPLTRVLQYLYSPLLLLLLLFLTLQAQYWLLFVHG